MTEVRERAAVEDFPEATDGFRRELTAHCYRMTGSIHDAEDLVQETYLRAWRAYAAFEGRSSVRTWLYRIATNVCLTALEGKDRRPLPAGPGGAVEQRRRPARGVDRGVLARAGARPAGGGGGRPTRRPSSRSARASGWRSSPPSSTCRPASAPC